MITPSAPWAKLLRGRDGRIIGWHSLVDHSADVAGVLLELLAQPTIARRLEALAGTAELDPATQARLGALAFLHDIGKANRGFRARLDPGAPLIGHIDTLAWLFTPNGAQLHTRLSDVLGLERLDPWFPDDEAGLLQGAFAHHGRPWKLSGLTPESGAYWRVEPAGEIVDPIADLAAMRVALDAWFPEAFATVPPLPAAPGFQHAFAGLLMLADWLASDTEFFPFADGQGGDRMAFARVHAAEALAAVGLCVEPGRAAVRASGLDFRRQFGVPAPRTIQEQALVPDARLVVLEAETGSGKTEAALWRFAHLFEQGEVDGLYFALPTRAAAGQIHSRVIRFRNGLFGCGASVPPVVRAVPGQVGADAASGHRLPDFGFGWSDDPGDGVRRSRWAAEHPKRFLAAQLAIGTLDQALLGAIAVKHAHLRAGALLRQLLVVDEVHASDTYMTGLLGALLRGHLAAGGHALLLSATLGGAARARLLGTTRPTLAEAEAAAYPALAWARDGIERRLRAGSTEAGKHVALEAAPMLDDPAGTASRALEAAQSGARVLIVRNTVAGAVAVQQALEAACGAAARLFRVAGVPTLHHGRFAPADRALLDAAVEAALGKTSPGEGRVVVGSQTLEQSLDLDADLLLTDLCPADVLLQRIGRLHRHRDRARPPGHAQARAIVLVPAERDLTVFARRGRHGLGAFVYEDLRVIEATWRLAEAHPEWRVPAMNRMLVERATHPEALGALEAELRTRDRAWGAHIDGYLGADGQRALEAGLASFDRSLPFADFQVADERLATRLGNADRQLAFVPAPPGPFGASVEALRLPYHWLDGASLEEEPSDVAVAGGTLAFRVGSARFRYDRLGLRRE